MDNKIVLVDATDNYIGLAAKLYTHHNSLRHRAFSIFVFRQNNGVMECLLQQRAECKYHCPGLWANTCCSHPNTDIELVKQAQVRLQTEMGFCTQLYWLDSFTYYAKCNNSCDEYEYDHLLFGVVNDIEIGINPQEVQAYKWINIKELNIFINNYNIAPWLPLAWHALSPHLDLIKAKVFG